MINGRRKIKPITAIDKKVSVIPYVDAPKQEQQEDELGNHLTERAPGSARKSARQAPSAIVDTDFGGALNRNNKAK